MEVDRRKESANRGIIETLMDADGCWRQSMDVDSSEWNLNGWRQWNGDGNNLAMKINKTILGVEYSFKIHIHGAHTKHLWVQKHDEANYTEKATYEAVSPACVCIPCGTSNPKKFGKGQCAPASPKCSIHEGSGNGGCYSSVKTACNLSSC